MGAAIKFVLLLFWLGLFSSVNTQKCQQKSFGKNKIVCVCNVNGCDSIDPIGQVDTNRFVKYVSSKNGLRFERTTGAVEDQKYSLVVELKPELQYQSILGWGGAFTDSFGINLLTLSPQLQDTLLKSYYGPDGLEYNFGRVPIGGSDFSTHAYEYNETPNDLKLTTFNITMEDHVYKIPIIKRAEKFSGAVPLKLLSAAWSPPAWMKTSKKLTGLGFLEDNCYQTWADYHIKFFEAYKKEGIQFWGVSTGNEPSNGMIPYDNFNAMGWTPATMRQWIAENFGPTIRKSEFSNLKILALDDQRYFLPWWINEIFDNETTRSLVDGIGIHWYGDGYTPIAVVESTHTKHPDKFLLYTEQCVGSGLFEKKVDIGSWSRGERYLSSIINNINHWVTGAIDWNLALDQSGGPNWANNNVDAPILINNATNEFYKQPMFYAMGHASKFVPAGSVRIGYTGSLPRNLELMSLKRPDGRYAVVLLNQGSKQRDLSVKVANKVFINLNVEAHSMVSVVF